MITWEISIPYNFNLAVNVFHSFCMTCVDENGLLRWWRFWQDFSKSNIDNLKTKNAKISRGHSLELNGMERAQLLWSPFSDSISDCSCSIFIVNLNANDSIFWLIERAITVRFQHTCTSNVGFFHHWTETRPMGRGRRRLTLSGFSDTNEFRRTHNNKRGPNQQK